MEKLPVGRPAGHPDMLGKVGNGIVGFVAGAIFDGLDGATGGIFGLDKLADRMRGTEQTAQQAAETAAAASNLAVLYNFDVAASKTKYPAVAPFSFPSVNYAVSGSNVALLSPTAGYPANASQRLGPDFRVTPEEKIYVEWRQRRMDANYLARVNIAILDASGAVIQSESPIIAGAPPLAVQPDATAANNQWAQYSGVVVIPVGAVSAIPQLRMQSSAGLDLSGSWAFDNVVIRRASGADLTKIEAELAGKANYSDIPTNVPLWQNLNPTDDPVFPLSSNVFISSGGDGSSVSETGTPTFATTSGEMDIGFIRATRDRDYTQVGLFTAKNWTGNGPLDVWLYVYKMNASTGALTQLWASDVRAALTSLGVSRQARFNIGSFPAQQGDVFAVGLHQRGNVLNPTRSIVGLKSPYLAPPAGTLPRGIGCYAPVGATFPAPTVISESSLVFTDDTVPWFVLG